MECGPQYGSWLRCGGCLDNEMERRGYVTGLVVLQVAGPLGNGFDVLELGLAGVPEFLGLCHGIGAFS